MSTYAIRDTEICSFIYYQNLNTIGNQHQSTTYDQDLQRLIGRSSPGQSCNANTVCSRTYSSCTQSS